MNTYMNRVVAPSCSLSAEVLLAYSILFSKAQARIRELPLLDSFPLKNAEDFKLTRTLLKKLYSVEQKAFSSNPKLIAGKKFFFEMFRRKHTVYSIAWKKRKPAGFAVANLVQESFNAIDNSLIKALKASLTPYDYNLFQKSLAEHKLYYLEDVAVTRVSLNQTNIMRTLFSALEERGATAFAFHGRMKNNAYRKLEKLTLKHGFRKAGEVLCENCAGGEKFMFMLFFKEALKQ